jgi:hypothetical protein
MATATPTGCSLWNAAPVTRRDKIIREYRAMYIADFGEDPPILEPDEDGFVMMDEVFPAYTTFFYLKEIKQMIAWMRARVRLKQKICDTR